MAPFEVSREGLVVLLCEAGPTSPCLCGGCDSTWGGVMTDTVEATPLALGS